MISRWRENPVWLQFLLGVLLFLFLTVLSYLIGLFQSSLPGMALFAKSNSTRTAIALTFQALLGPFPTATGPTPTPSWTPSMTSTPTVTPSITPTPTRVRYFLNTSTPRTLVPGAPSTVQPQPTRTSVPATQQPRATGTRGVQATDPPPQPTNPPRRPTKRTKKATKTPKPPKKYVPMAECIYVPGCYDYALRLENEYPVTRGFPGLLPLAIPAAIPDEP